MAEAVPKEAVEFITRLGGAVLSSLEDYGLEYYARTTPGAVGKFPYTRLHPNLPRSDDLIVAGLAIAPWVIGLLVEEDAKKKGDIKTAELGKGLREFGEGNVCYAVPMCLKEGLTTIPVAGARRPPTRGGTPPPSRRTPGIVVKL